MTQTPIQVLYQNKAIADVKLKRKTSQWQEGVCSLCGNTALVAPGGSILGKNFGSWSDLTNNNVLTQLCKPCAWSFKEKTLLRTVMFIESDRVKEITWSDLSAILMNSTISSTSSIIAPVGGRKIVAPYAQWGYLSSDYGNIRWEPRYQRALRVCSQLNKIGLRGSMLLYAQIPYSVLEDVPLDKHQVIHEMWNYLEFIKEDKTLSNLFVKLSMNIGKDVQ